MGHCFDEYAGAHRNPDQGIIHGHRTGAERLDHLVGLPLRRHEDGPGVRVRPRAAQPVADQVRHPLAGVVPHRGLAAHRQVAADLRGVAPGVWLGIVRIGRCNQRRLQGIHFGEGAVELAGPGNPMIGGVENRTRAPAGLGEFVAPGLRPRQEGGQQFGVGTGKGRANRLVGDPRRGPSCPARVSGSR